jgi:hypothetical protein
VILAINTVGAVTTGVALFIIVAAKFTDELTARSRHFGDFPERLQDSFKVRSWKRIATVPVVWTASGEE